MNASYFEIQTHIDPQGNEVLVGAGWPWTIEVSKRFLWQSPFKQPWVIGTSWYDGARHIRFDLANGVGIYRCDPEQTSFYGTETLTARLVKLQSKPTTYPPPMGLRRT